MAAAVRAMESRGMTEHIESMLQNNNFANSPEAMRALQESKNAAFRAYGTMGNVGGSTVSFKDFMQGTGSSGQSMKNYIDSRGDAAASELANDAAAMNIISNYQKTTPNEIVNTKALADITAQSSDANVLRSANSMLVTGTGTASDPFKVRNDIDKVLNENHAARMDNSTVDLLMKTSSGIFALDGAVESLSRRPDLVNQLSDSRRTIYNNTFRGGSKTKL